MDNLFISTTNKHRLSQRGKEENDFRWYKDHADNLDHQAFGGNSLGFGGVSERKRKSINYNLFNGIIDEKEFEYVCKPYGAETGDLPANMVNRDIVSGKIKVLLGMEMKMPFSWKVLAVNPEATTRKEQYEFNLIRDYVQQEVMRPLRIEMEQKAAEAETGREMAPEEKAALQKQLQEEMNAKTPEESRKYMAREHQDPAEVLSQQLMEYLRYKEKINQKFNKGFKHLNLSGEEFFYVGISRGEPILKAINAIAFDYDRSPDLDCVSEGEWAVCEYAMTPSQIIAEFGDQLKNDEIDRIYDRTNNHPTNVANIEFTFDDVTLDDGYTVRVRHFVWKALRKIGFLTYMSKATGKLEEMPVDENYKINKLAGDISIDWEYIPEWHETYKILGDIYVYMRPGLGQHKDLDNLYECHLPYYGSGIDNLNAPATSPMDRMKAYQYFYNVIVYRIELLMASDGGKKLAMNINAIPKSAGIDIDKMMYFMKANNIIFMNPQEEGNRGGQGGDVTNLVKEVDMSLISDIGKYIEVASYIEKKCGDAIGVNANMEGSTSPNEAVTNTRQNLIQTGHIIQPFFELHNNVKANVLSALLEKAKVAYSTGKPRKLSYMLDDLSYQMIDLSQSNMALLENSTLGIFVANSTKADDAKKAVEALSQAALQNQQADLGDIVKIIRAESINEASELLDAAAARKATELQAIEKAKLQSQEAQFRQQMEQDRTKRDHEKELVVLKETERRKTVIQEQTILALGFNEDKDMNDNGTPDVLEVAKFGVDTKLKSGKLALDQRKMEHQIGIDKKKLEQQDEKLRIDNKKANQKPASK